MNQFEQMKRNLGVDLKERTNRRFKNERKSAEDWRAKTNKEHNKAREALLNDGFPMLEGYMEALRDHKKARIEVAMF